MDYLSVKEAAQLWGVGQRSVHKYCKEGKIEGAIKFGKSWAIPCDAKKPIDNRKKSIRYTDLEVTKTQNQTEITYGALIVASNVYNKDEISPLTNIGKTSLIRRLVLIFQQAHISRVVVVTGYDSLELEHHLSDYGVIFINNQNFKKTDKFQSAKLGLEFLKETCDKVFFTSLKIPMFMPQTIMNMKNFDKDVIIPRFKEKNGHPILIDSKIIDDILNFSGDGGMRGALNSLKCTKKYLEVNDEGIVLDATDKTKVKELLPVHNQNLLHPFVRLSIEKNKIFFNSRSKMLLFLIQESNSIQEACKKMALSKGKAFDMINDAERELGFTIVQRQRGGSRNRKTYLTKKGEEFLDFYTKFEESVTIYAKTEFDKMFNEFLGK